MAIEISAVIEAKPRQIPAFTALHFIDLAALGIYGSPLAVVDDFRVREMPFSAHPHAGFAAVTYVFEDSPGGLRSRTSTGTDVVVGPGGFVWTNAGRGVIHEEVPATRGLELHGLQLFVNLTSENKLSAPWVLALEGHDVPGWEGGAEGNIRVVVGRFDGVSSPFVPDEPFTLLDVELGGRIHYKVETAHNAVIYALKGRISVRTDSAEVWLNGGQVVGLSGGGESVELEAINPAHLLVISGLRIDEPFVEEGPFIMNDRSQIEAAIARYRSGEMGGLSPR
jgi:redox-sensitive bicupin YhaK (pirin superfamily)